MTTSLVGSSSCTLLLLVPRQQPLREIREGRLALGIVADLPDAVEVFALPFLRIALRLQRPGQVRHGAVVPAHQDRLALVLFLAEDLLTQLSNPLVRVL